MRYSRSTHYAPWPHHCWHSFVWHSRTQRSFKRISRLKTRCVQNKEVEQTKQTFLLWNAMLILCTDFFCYWVTWMMIGITCVLTVILFPGRREHLLVMPNLMRPRRATGNPWHRWCFVQPVPLIATHKTQFKKITENQWGETKSFILILSPPPPQSFPAQHDLGYLVPLTSLSISPNELISHRRFPSPWPPLDHGKQTSNRGPGQMLHRELRAWVLPCCDSTYCWQPEMKGQWTRHNRSAGHCKTCSVTQPNSLTV